MTAPLQLLDEAARLLRDDTAPALSGQARYHVLLAAKAVDTARRELEVAPRLASLQASLSTTLASLRDGTHDDDGALYARLRDAAILRAYVSDPETLSAEERARFEALSR